MRPNPIGILFFPIFCVVLVCSGCNRPGGQADLAPKSDDENIAIAGAKPGVEGLTERDLQKIRTQYAAPTPTESGPAPTPLPVTESAEENVAVASCERWSEQAQKRYTYTTFRQVGDLVEGFLHDNRTGERIRITPGLNQAGLTVESLDGNAVVLSGGGCQVTLMRQTELPTPEPSQALDSDLVMLCGDTIQHFRMIADVMAKYFEKNGYYPYPEDMNGNPIESDNPQAAVAGFLPKALVERDVYLRTYPKDAFSEKGALPFRYACIPTQCWIVVGNGPDGDADINPLNKIASIRAADTDSFFSVLLPEGSPIYHPGNGPKSNGDIVVWGPGGEVSLSEEQLTPGAGKPVVEPGVHSF